MKLKKKLLLVLTCLSCFARARIIRGKHVGLLAKDVNFPHLHVGLPAKDVGLPAIL